MLWKVTYTSSIKILSSSLPTMVGHITSFIPKTITVPFYFVFLHFSRCTSTSQWTIMEIRSTSPFNLIAATVIVLYAIWGKGLRRVRPILTSLAILIFHSIWVKTLDSTRSPVGAWLWIHVRRIHPFVELKYPYGCLLEGRELIC